jgi:hypothetical protein
MYLKNFLVFAKLATVYSIKPPIFALIAPIQSWQPIDLRLDFVL